MTIDMTRLYRLRLALLGDAVFETVCGLAFLVGANALAAWSGWNVPALFMVAGAALLVVAALLIWMARQIPPPIPLARAIAWINLICAVAAGLALLTLWGSLAEGARWLLIIIGLGVGIFGVLELLALRRHS